MGKSLVIVESPAKAKTIAKFLGKDYKVEACVGHVRALPSKPGSVDIVDVINIPYKDIAVFIGMPDKDIADLSDEDIAARILDFVADDAYIAKPYKEEADFLAAHIPDFISAHIPDVVVPKYDIIPRSKKYLKEINKSLKGCDAVYLATDLDREGEAIAWHLVSALKLDKETSKGPKYTVKRITFHEITKEAIAESLRKPGDIAVDLVDAQQARVVLDYLVGFNLSPLLWKKIRYGLSAGRVQSVALRIICEREAEIKAFVTDEYWTVKARLTPKDIDSPFEAQLIQIKGEKLDKLAIKDEEQANEIVSQLEAAEYIVSEIKKREVKRTPPPPFITSTLQQEASRKLGFSARRTMSTAQKLYEGIDVGKGTMGLITYMRTDSVHLAASAVSDIHAVITKEYGEDYALKTPRIFPPNQRMFRRRMKQ